LDAHISTKKLFFVAAGEEFLTPQESWHFRKCEECRELKKVFVRLASYDQNGASKPPKKAVNE